MNAAAKPTGLQVGSTRPLSRADRRANAARVRADEDDIETPVSNQTPPLAQNPPPANDDPVPPPPPTPPAAAPPETQSAKPVQLRARERKAKSPFATQLHAGTLARLEWIKARGFVITDTVDTAINTYLDAAGIPRPDRNDRMA
jgi:hypothetical protein